MLAEAFGAEVSASRCQVYIEALKDIETGMLAQACNACISVSRFFPTVAEIRERALGSEKDRTEERALSAWERVVTAVGSWHPDRGWWPSKPRMSAAEDRAMAAAGGPRAIWENFSCGGDDTTDSSPFIRKRFLEAYTLSEKSESWSAKELPGGEEGFKKMAERFSFPK